MNIDKQRADEIKQVFRQVYDYKEEASDLTKSANDLLKTLSEKIDPENPKPILAGLKKAYKEYVGELKGEEDSLEPCLIILQAIGGEG